MEPLKLGDRQIPLKLPLVPDRIGLLALLRKYEEAPAVIARLKMAAIGLAWDSGQVPAPWAGGLASAGWDLVRFGETVSGALAETGDPWPLFVESTRICGEIVASLAPAKEKLEEARDFLADPPAAGSPPASASDTGTLGIPLHSSP